MAITSTNGTAFTFNGAYLTGAWNDGLNITVDGFNNGAKTYTKTVIASAHTPTYFDFDFSNIDTLHFSGIGGLNAGFSGSGTHFVMDNFTYNEATHATPEPATMLLVGSGIAGLIGARRKKKAQA
jgi:hypothetical protein